MDNPFTMIYNGLKRVLYGTCLWYVDEKAFYREFL